MGEGANQVHIKLRRGSWEVEVTCPEDRVKQVVESVLAGLSSAPAVAETFEPAEVRRTTTCRGLVEELWRDGWFTSERALGDVDEELARRGYHYDRTAVSHTLMDLVRENVLTRLGAARNYRYVQKKPP